MRTNSIANIESNLRNHQNESFEFLRGGETVRRLEIDFVGGRWYVSVCTYNNGAMSNGTTLHSLTCGSKHEAITGAINHLSAIGYAS